MNNQEYAIINKTALEEKIEALSKELIRMFQKNYSETSKLQIEFILLAYKDVLSKSVSLIPEIEKAFDKGREYQRDLGVINSKENYLSNLKLDI